ncbi:YeiH family protein, partial [Bacillus velezensis]
MTDTLAKRKSFSLGNWLGGIGFTFIIALVGFGLSKLPVLDHIGQLACAIIIAVIYRQIRGYPEKFRTGIQFSAKRLLRFAIILFGLKLNIDVVLHQGLGLLVRDVGSIVFAIFLTILIGKLLKADSSLSLLLGIGTGVCGAAAIAAVSPILKAKDEDTAIGAGIIALVGTIFAIGYTILRPFLPLTDLQYGIWSGVGLHEIAHVALAGAPAGPDGLAIALLAKLG